MSRSKKLPIQNTFGELNEDVLSSLIQSIKKLEKIFLDEFDLKIYLTWGTLLGAVREGDFIKHDNDIDIAYLSNRKNDYEITEEHELIVRVLYRSGFPVYRNSKGQIHVQIKPENSKLINKFFNLDLWTTFVRDGQYFHYPDIKGEIASNALLPLQRQQLHGESFWVPADYDLVLTQFYGSDWREPNKGYQWFPRYDSNDVFEFLRSSAFETSMPDFPIKAKDLIIVEKDDFFFIESPGLVEGQRLNSTGMLILELCTGDNSPKDIIELLQSAYQLDSPPEIVVLEFITNSLASGLIVNTSKS